MAKSGRKWARVAERGTEEEKEAASVGAFSEMLIDVANEPALSPDISHRHAQTLCGPPQSSWKCPTPSHCLLVSVMVISWYVRMPPAAKWLSLYSVRMCGQEYLT